LIKTEAFSTNNFLNFCGILNSNTKDLSIFLIFFTLLTVSTCP